MSSTDRLSASSDPPRVHSLHLTRPLAVFDLESTGTAPSADRIIEISVVKLSPDEAETTLRRRVNSQVPIPSDATAVHGITDADVAGEPTFAETAGEIKGMLEGCDLGGSNVVKFGPADARGGVSAGGS